MNLENGYDITHEIDYRQYTDDFYAASSCETDEDILCVTMQEAIDGGMTPLDVDLYCAVERFEYAKVLLLLKKGANPYAPLEYSTAEERIWAECAHLDTEVVRIWRSYFEANDIQKIDIRQISDLIGWAAHEKMYDILMNNSWFCPTF